MGFRIPNRITILGSIRSWFNTNSQLQKLLKISRTNFRVQRYNEFGSQYTSTEFNDYQSELPSWFFHIPKFHRMDPELNIIGLNGNDIQHIPAENIRNVNATELHLESNDLTSIPEYTAYPNITTLRVRNNQLTTLPDFFNTTLKQLQISQNPLRCDQAPCWIRMSPWVFDTTILMDAPTCASPTAEDGKLLMGVTRSPWNATEVGRCHFTIQKLN